MKKFLLLFVLICVSVNPQNLNMDNDIDFKKAVALYNSKNYDDALIIFTKLSNRSANNSKQSASAFFISKIFVDQNKSDKALKAINDFLSKYPQSNYADEVRNLLIKSNIDKQDYSKAFSSALDLIEVSNFDVTKKETKEIAQRISLNYLTASDVEEQIVKYKSSNIKSFLYLLNGKILLREGDKINALKSFNEITSKFISSDEYAEASNLKKTTMQNNLDVSTPLVGVMLSLTDESGKEIQSAKEILEGIKFAFHEYNSLHDEKIGLIISDVQSNKNTITKTSSDFILNDDVRCIIGPIFSDDVRNAVKEISRSNICLISPTATDDDLVSLSENFYQANPSLISRGKIFAQYIYFVENKRSIAVLNSIDGYSPLLAISFAQEFEKLGGKIVIKQTYKSKSFSISEQITKISALAKSIDGIYAPISDKNDASAILSQMASSNLRLDIYGNQDWFAAKGLETSSQSGIKLTFDSDYFIDFNDSDFKTFSVLFKQTTGIESDRNALYGYDAGKYILTVMRNIDPTRINIKYKIESGLSVSGFHNNISFDENRINKYVNIVKYKDGAFELVDKFRSGK